MPEFSTEMLRTVLNAVGDGALVAGDDGAVIAVNARAEELLGKGAESPQWLGIDGRALSAADQPISRALAGETLADARMRVRTPAGTLVDVLVNAGPVTADGKTVGASVSVRPLDLTATMFRAVAAAVSETIYRVSPTGIVEFISRVPDGLTPDELLGQSIYDFVPPDAQSVLQESIIRAVETRSATTCDVKVPGEQNVAVYRNRIQPLVTENAVTALVILSGDVTAERDVSAVRQRDLELQEHALRELSAPVIQVWQDVIAMPILGLVDSARAALMMEVLLKSVVKTQSHFAILDLTGVEAVDTSTANHLIKMVQAVRLLGANCSFSGISPAIAHTIAELGVDMQDTQTFATLHAALEFAINRVRAKSAGRKQ